MMGIGAGVGWGGVRPSSSSLGQSVVAFGIHTICGVGCKMSIMGVVDRQALLWSQCVFLGFYSGTVPSSQLKAI